MLRAFKLDATKLRYRDWDDLMEYCRYSASPVGRQLLDLHGESRDTWPPSDALCSALQVLNHLQDCAADYTQSRPRLSARALARRGSARRVEDLRARTSNAGLRRVFDRLLDGTDKLIAQARALPPLVESPGLRRECAVIVDLAARLSRRLRHGDPLAMRVETLARRFPAALLTGLLRGGRG